MAAIYALLCKETTKAYIGCTKGKLAKRLREHRCLLNSGGHSCRGLQADWSRLGEISFAMQMVEQLPPDAPVAMKRERELYWMAWFDDCGRLYNENRNSFAPTKEATLKGIEASRHVEGRKRSPEANLKRSLAQKGKPKGHGAKISATKQARKAQQVMI